MSATAQRMVVGAAVIVLAVVGFNAVSGSRPRALAATTPHSTMPSFLRFDGDGQDAIRPDRATIHFTTNGRGSTLIDATNQASRAMRRVIAAMHAGKVARINMQTDGANGSRTSSGDYEAEQNLTVTVMKVGTTGKLIAAGINAGATANYGPDFSSKARASAQSRGNPVRDRECPPESRRRGRRGRPPRHRGDLGFRDPARLRLSRRSRLLGCQGSSSTRAGGPDQARLTAGQRVTDRRVRVFGRRR